MIKILNIARVASNLGLAVSGSIVGIFAKINFCSVWLKALIIGQDSLSTEKWLDCRVALRALRNDEGKNP